MRDGHGQNVDGTIPAPGPFPHVHVLVTRNDDGGSGIDHAAVGPDAVPPGCGRFHFETYSFVRWVLQFKVGGDYICERTCGTNTHTQSSRLTHEQKSLLFARTGPARERRRPSEAPRVNSPNHRDHKRLNAEYVSPSGTKLKTKATVGWRR